mmetsp:Transcript_14266/g.28714  ORF Transcript_14266/g.28714 Transcript_14266/m.28714 type:complete len:277 (+) Transcript_14266:313-1143(+)
MHGKRGADGRSLVQGRRRPCHSHPLRAREDFRGSSTLRAARRGRQPFDLDGQLARHARQQIEQLALSVDWRPKRIAPPGSRSHADGVWCAAFASKPFTTGPPCLRPRLQSRPPRPLLTVVRLELSSRGGPRAPARARRKASNAPWGEGNTGMSTIPRRIPRPAGYQCCNSAPPRTSSRPATATNLPPRRHRPRSEWFCYGISEVYGERRSAQGAYATAEQRCWWFGVACASGRISGAVHEGLNCSPGFHFFLSVSAYMCGWLRPMYLLTCVPALST